MFALRLGAVLCSFIAVGNAVAQERPAFQNLRFEENWRAFQPGNDAPPLDRIKHIGISDKVWLSIGGELRLRMESWDGFGFDDSNDDTYLLHRTFLHTDWHFGEHVRLFVQGRYSGLTGRDLPGNRRDALDRDQGDLWNTFLEFHGVRNKFGWHARVGRQELSFGKQRLVSPLDWSNNRRIFDGVSVRFQDNDGRWQVDAFSVSPVVIDGDTFTWNNTDDARLFSGVYYSQRIGGAGHVLDAYVLSLNHIDHAPVMEDRITIGVRATGPIVDNLTYELEAAYQFGDRTVDGLSWNRHYDVRAWMATAELKYVFSTVNWKPFLVAGVDYASGDRDATDWDNNTFLHLFPLGHAYLGFIDAVGRQNIIDYRFSAGAWPIAQKVKVQADVHVFQRASRQDGLYNAGGALSRPFAITTPGGRSIEVDDRSVGQELDLTLLWNPNHYFSTLFGYSHFWAGNYIQETGSGDDTDFFYGQAQFRF